MMNWLAAVYTVKAIEMQSKKAKKGQSLAEYGLILALVSVVCIVVLQTMGTELGRIITEINGALGMASVMQQG